MKTRTLHQSAHYTAHHVPGTHGGIVITSARSFKGAMLRSDHPQYSDYLEAFQTSLDAVESDALCRALLAP